MPLATFGAIVPPALLSPPLCAVLELARLGRWLQPPAELEGRSMALTLTPWLASWPVLPTRAVSATSGG